MIIPMIKRLTFVYGLALVAIVILADSGRASWVFAALAQVPLADKLGHFVLMGAMSFLLTLVSRADRIAVGAWSLLRAPFWLAVVVLLEEFSQIWLVNRGFSVLDLAFDFAGIICFALLAERILMKAQPRAVGDS
jgi:VanZ family protein